MNASLDTDVVIHLYRTGKKDLLLMFDSLYIYEYLVEEELKRKSRITYDEVMVDVAAEWIKIITRQDLIRLGVKGLFEQYLIDNKNLFDDGEMHAIALAQAMGLFALVSDDTKQFGPHDTLVRGLIADVMPFAFYELLFLRYLNSELTTLELHGEFDIVVAKLEKPMEFSSRIKRTIRRFTGKEAEKRDLEWFRSYCAEKQIDYHKRIRDLLDYLRTLEK
jgi:predicted nucleic acid-binding protein